MDRSGADQPETALLAGLGARTDELQEGHPEQAYSWLQKAAKVDPSDTEVQYALVSCLQLQGKQKEAAETLQVYERQKVLLDRANKLLKSEAEHPSNDPELYAEIG